MLPKLFGKKRRPQLRPGKAKPSGPPPKYDVACRLCAYNKPHTQAEHRAAKEAEHTHAFLGRVRDTD